MVVLEYYLVAFVNGSVAAVDLCAPVLMLTECADVKIVRKYRLNGNNAPFVPDFQTTVVAALLDKLLLPCARSGYVLVCKVVGDLFVAPAFVVQPEYLPYRRGGNFIDGVYILVRVKYHISVGNAAQPLALALAVLNDASDLFARVCDRHFIHKKVQLYLHPVVMGGIIDVVAYRDYACAIFDEILEFREPAARAP